MSNPVALTGRPFGEFHEVAEITFGQLEGIFVDGKYVFTYKIPSDLQSDVPEWWSEDPLDDINPRHSNLVEKIGFAPCIQGQNGSGTMFAAACEVLRHGVTGREAEALLRTVPQEPEFSPKELQRIIECAYLNVLSRDEFATCGAANEFDIIPPPPPPPEEMKYGFWLVSLANLDEMDLPLIWLAEGALTAEGAIFFGGRQKTFKTGVAMDLAISSATGHPFLGRFPIPQLRRSVFFSAEIGRQRLKSLTKSICKAKGVDPRLVVKNLMLSDWIPQIAVSPNNQQLIDPIPMRMVEACFAGERPDLAFFDPLYFAMAGGSTSDMYAVASCLRQVTKVCQAYNVQPVFVHHAKKDPSKEFQPMELGDLSGAGMAEFARQWFLMAHKEPFRNGVARLSANIGGSSQGSRGLWDLTIDEGIPDAIIMERKWRVTMEEVDENGISGTEDAQAMILECIKFNDGATLDDLKAYVDVDEKTLKRIVFEMGKAGSIQKIGRKFERAVDGKVV